MGNPVVHFEVGASDDVALQRFYADLFGWSLQQIPGVGYTLVDTCSGGGVNGGIGHSPDGSAWATFYVEADNIQVVLDKAESMGGKTVQPVTEIPNMATWAMFTDPDGLLVGLVQRVEVPDQHPSSGEGAAIDWFEVLGADGQRTRSFYAELFGWKVPGEGSSGYWFVDTGTDRGIRGALGSASEARWATVYAHVADIDKTLTRAEQLGGRREYGPNTIDDHMRTGAIRDPAGSVVGVYEHRH